MIYTTIISYEDWKEDIKYFIESFDEDASGRNGKDYLLKEAIEIGYDNNIDYWINEANKEFSDVEDKVERVLSLLDDTYGSYDFHEYKIDTSAEDFLIVVFVAEYSV